MRRSSEVNVTSAGIACSATIVVFTNHLERSRCPSVVRPIPTCPDINRNSTGHAVSSNVCIHPSLHGRHAMWNFCENIEPCFISRVLDAGNGPLVTLVDHSLVEKGGRGNTLRIHLFGSRCSSVNPGLSQKTHRPGSFLGICFTLMNQECDSRPIDNDQPDLRKIAERMERGIRRFLNTPPQPRGDRPDDASATQPRRSRKRLQEPKERQK